MKVAVLLPFSPSDSSNSGVARLEMFRFLPGVKIDRYHFGPSSDGDFSVGQYFPEASPRNIGSFWRLYKSFGKQHRQKPYQAIWTTLPPVLMALFARILAWRYGLPFIVDVRDPGIASVVITHPKNSWHYRLAHGMEKWLYRGATKICVTTPELATLLNREFGVKLERTVVVSNATVEKVIPTRQLNPRKITVFYAGTFAPYQLIDKAVANLLKTPPGANFIFEFYGYEEKKNPRLATLVNKAKAKNWLKLHSRISRQELFGIIQQSDIVLVPIEFKADVALYDYAIPLKLYEALAFSRPVILFGGTAASRRLVTEASFGVVCPSNQPLSGALKKVVSDYPRFKANAAVTHFSRKTEAQKLLAIFKELFNTNESKR